MKNKPNLKSGERTVLCIGAHPDDCEFRCGGIASLWSALGDHIIFLSLTDGASGTFEANRDIIAARRRKESIASAGILGGASLCMGCPDGLLEPSLENREKLIQLIRMTSPDIILTNRLNDYHPDHRYTSQLVQDASYMLQVPNIVSDVAPLRYVPVIMYWGDSFVRPYQFSPRMVVDIDSVVETKISMLMQHGSQMFEWLPWVDGILDHVPAESGCEAARRAWVMALYKRRAVPTYADRFRSFLEKRYGTSKANTVVEAEAFEICEYGYKLSTDDLELLFDKV